MVYYPRIELHQILIAVLLLVLCPFSAKKMMERNAKEKEFEKEKTEEEKNAEKKRNSKMITVIVIATLIMIALAIGFLDNDGDKWNSLSDEEKEWYIDNFGDGQYDEIQDAISDYRGY